MGKEAVQDALELVHGRHLDLEKEAILSGDPVALGDLRSVRGLQPEGAVTMRSLADQLRYDASNLTGVIDRLEERGAVRRQPHPQDRRVKGVMLTDQGARLRLAFWNRLTGRSGPLGQLERQQLDALRTLLTIALDG